MLKLGTIKWSRTGCLLLLLMYSITGITYCLKNVSYYQTHSANIIIFLPREAMLSAVYAVVVCLCVCVCVCLSHSGIVSKRLNVGSRKQRRTIAP